MSDIVSVHSAQWNQRRSFLLATVLSTVGAILIFILSRAFLVNQDFIGSIYENGVPCALGGLFLLTFPYLHQRLEGKRRLSFSHLPDGAVPFEGYTLPWQILLVYGVLLAFAVGGAGLFLIWLVGMTLGFFWTQAVSVLNLLLLLIGFYYLGSWIGSRSARSPYFIAAGTVVGYIILELLVTLLLNIHSPLQSVFGLGMFLILSLVAAFTGAWTGQRKRLSAYVHFLLSRLPEEDRQRLINSLYREVKQQMSNDH